MQKVRHLKRIKVCVRKVQFLSYPAKCFMDYLVKKGIVAGANSRAMSIDVALSTCCDDRSNAY